MQAQFWLDKWNNQETGFHLDSAHPLLKKFYSQIFSSEDGVFVPLCGKSSDLAFIADKGSYTLGCELCLCPKTHVAVLIQGSIFYIKLNISLKLN